MTGFRSISSNSASVNISKNVSSSSSKKRTDAFTGSPLGQDRAAVLKKGREVWTESMANISNADEQPQYSKRAEQITPKMLKTAQLKKVPVYMAARNLENKKTPNVHGFVAIGRPGQRGAKVFSHGTVDMHREFTLTMDSFKALRKKHDDGRDVFTSQCRRSLMLMLTQHGGSERLHFKSFQDFHRLLFITEMQDFKDRYDPNDKEKFPNPGDYERTLKHWQYRINAEAHNIYNVLTADPSCSGDSDGSDLRYVTPSGKYTTEEEGIFFKHPTGDESVDEFGFGPPGTKYTHDINDKVNLAELDARAFESPDAKKKLTLNEQKSLKATDVLEAQQTQSLRRNFMDEKTRMIDGLGLAPELIEPMRSEQDIQKFSQRAQSRLDEDQYAPVHSGGDAMKKDDIHAARRYKTILTLKNIKRFFKNLPQIFSKSKKRIATPGNCNSAAGSLLRYAGRMRGQKVSVKSGFWQHGVNTDVHWDPTPNLKHKPQTSNGTNNV